MGRALELFLDSNVPFDQIGLLLNFHEFWSHILIFQISKLKFFIKDV